MKVTEDYQEAVNKNEARWEKRFRTLEEDIVNAIAARKAAETILQKKIQQLTLWVNQEVVEVGRRQQRMGENIQTMQEMAMEAMKDYEREAETLTEQKCDAKVYNADDEISPGGESTQELRKAKTSHSGKGQTMSE
jgi:hypothetical protein